MILAEKDVYINSTVVYCPKCGCNEMGCIIANKKGVFLEKRCPDHGAELIKIAADYKWYAERNINPKAVAENKNVYKSQKGCPLDCGICEWHSGSVNRIIIPVSNNYALNGKKKNKSTHVKEQSFKSLEDMRCMAGHLIKNSGSNSIIHLIGENVLLHPDLFEIIEMLKLEGFDQIELDTDGIDRSEDLDFMNKIKRSDVRLSISIEAFSPQNITELKFKTLDISEKLQIPVNMFLSYQTGANEQDITGIIHKYLKKNFIRNITIRNKIFFGNNYQGSQNGIETTIDGIEKIISGVNDISLQDFSIHASYHPLCYSAAYYIISEDSIIPLSSIFDKNELAALSEKCCQPNKEKDFTQSFRDSLNRLWSSGVNPQTMKALKQFVEKIYTSNSEGSNKDRWKSAAQMIKGIFIHQYMDESCFDIDRVSHCGDFFVDDSNKMIPVCSHNILYH